MNLVTITKPLIGGILAVFLLELVLRVTEMSVEGNFLYWQIGAFIIGAAVFHFASSARAKKSTDAGSN